MIVRQSDCTEYAPCLVASFFVTVVLIIVMFILFRGHSKHNEINYDDHPRNLKGMNEQVVNEAFSTINETRVVTLGNGLIVEVKPIGYRTMKTEPITTEETNGQIIENGHIRPMTKEEEANFNQEIIAHLNDMKAIQDILDQSLDMDQSLDIDQSLDMDPILDPNASNAKSPVVISPRNGQK